jgi:uncharacterized protein YqjF (DUF2071 family)
MDASSRRFLTAEWRSLAMLNYEIDPSALQSFVPKGTELDKWRGKTFISMVGFRFLKTRIHGIAIPFHSNFEEVNLRFYVRRLAPDGWRRAVVFINELVPRRAIAWVARAFYNENYKTVPMSHQLQLGDDGSIHRAVYNWQFGGRRNQMGIRTEGKAAAFQAGSEEEFITEHYWGYSRQRNGGTVEYRVDHPPWRVSSSVETILEVDVEGLYGRNFVPFIKGPPVSAFLAEGSAVAVSRGERLECE